MPSTSDLLTLGVLGLVAWRLVGAARVAVGGPGRARVLLIVRGIRWRHVWPVPLVLAAVGGAATGLITAVPALGIGWWTLLGGQGNPAFGSASVTSGTVWSWLLPLVFVAFLVPALPLFAQREEEIFRLGAELRTPRQRWWRSLLFGLVHCVVGIPVGVALALTIGGVYFTHRYLRAYRATGDRAAALLESTRAHAAYNGLIVALLAVGLVLQAVTG